MCFKGLCSVQLAVIIPSHTSMEVKLIQFQCREEKDVGGLGKNARQSEGETSDRNEQK